MNGKIPIQNVFYMFCYAWREYRAGKQIDLAPTETSDLANLLTQVLVEGTTRLIKRGLAAGYVSESLEVAGVRGQVDFDASLKKLLFQHGKSQCHVDELSKDVLENQILRATLACLARNQDLDRKLRERVRGLLPHFTGVGELPHLSPRLFRTTTSHRNNREYRLLLNVCELILRQLLLTEESGVTRFRDVLEDEVTMNRVFEKFVRNFYIREHTDFKVTAPSLHWHATAKDPAHKAFLPQMNTDIVLSGGARTIIIDTKYYTNTLTTGRRGKDKDKIHSKDLYQLYAYLRSFRRKHGRDARVEGMLLYPTIDQSLRLDYEIEDFRVQVCTVDLAQPWRDIESELLALVPLHAGDGQECAQSIADSN